MTKFTNTCCNIWAWTKYYCLKTRFRLALSKKGNGLLKTICFVFAGLLLIIFACSTNNQSFLKTEKRYPPWNDDVKVYYYTSREAYKKIGIVSTKGSAKVPMHYLIADLQQKAANIGASRIYVHPPTVGVDFVKLTATAIR